MIRTARSRQALCMRILVFTLPHFTTNSDYSTEGRRAAKNYFGSFQVPKSKRYTFAHASDQRVKISFSSVAISFLSAKDFSRISLINHSCCLERLVAQLNHLICHSSISNPPISKLFLPIFCTISWFFSSLRNSTKISLRRKLFILVSKPLQKDSTFKSSRCFSKTWTTIIYMSYSNSVVSKLPSTQLFDHAIQGIALPI